MDEKMSDYAIGWREWVNLPGLSLHHIKCKVDTGARTSALHAYFVEPYDDNGLQMVRFGVHPKQGKNKPAIVCMAEVLEVRDVTDSGGHTETRYVIRTDIVIGRNCFPVELTLTNRDTMKFRMLLGRTAMLNRFVVYPGESYLQGKPAV